MTKTDRDMLLGIFMAALQAVIPDLTDERRRLLRDVVDGMLQERAIGNSAIIIDRRHIGIEAK